MKTLESIQLPGDLRARAQAPFSFSWGFTEELGPDLGITRPPYTFQLPSTESLQRLENLGGPESLVVKLHTLQYSWMIEEAHQRRQEWLAGHCEEILQATGDEIESRLEGWKQMVSIEEGSSSEQEQMIIGLAIEWGARRIDGLVDELKIRCKGRGEYEAAERRSELPWQRIIIFARKNYGLSYVSDDADDDEEVA